MECQLKGKGKNLDNLQIVLLDTEAQCTVATALNNVRGTSQTLCKSRHPPTKFRTPYDWPGKFSPCRGGLGSCLGPRRLVSFGPIRGFRLGASQLHICAPSKGGSREYRFVSSCGDGKNFPSSAARLPPLSGSTRWAAGSSRSLVGGKKGSALAGGGFDRSRGTIDYQ